MGPKPIISFSRPDKNPCKCKKGDRCCCVASNEPCIKNPCEPPFRLKCDGTLLPTHPINLPLALASVKQVSGEIFPCGPTCNPYSDCRPRCWYDEQQHPLYLKRHMRVNHCYKHPVVYTIPPVPYWDYLFKEEALQSCRLAAAEKGIGCPGTKKTMKCGPCGSCGTGNGKCSTNGCDDCGYTTKNEFKRSCCTEQGGCRPVFRGRCPDCSFLSKWNNFFECCDSPAN